MATAAAAAPLATTKRAAVHALRAARGVNMPSRAIAAVLLRAPGPVAHDELYSSAAEYGLLKSRRHFKHVLKLMKGMKRLEVICLGPERPGSAKRAFSVKLTRRGQTIYTRYLDEDGAGGQGEERAPGLQDAL